MEVQLHQSLRKSRSGATFIIWCDEGMGVGVGVGLDSRCTAASRLVSSAAYVQISPRVTVRVNRTWATLACTVDLVDLPL